RPQPTPTCITLRIYSASLTSHPSHPPPHFTPSLHDALPISVVMHDIGRRGNENHLDALGRDQLQSFCAAIIFSRDAAVVGLKIIDRKSTRLNCSHQIISYAVFGLKKQQEYE